MNVPIAAVLAGGTALAAYLNARLLIGHDLRTLKAMKTMATSVAWCEKRRQENKLLIYHLFEEHATGPNGDNLCLMFEGRSWTYKQFFADIHRTANWLMKDLDIQRGELVALDGGNSPEYLLLWFGLEAIGACPSFINNNLTAAPLLHCIKLCEARYVLADRDVQSLMQPCEEELSKSNVQVVYYDPQFIAGLSDTTPTPASRREGFLPTDLSCLLYTSGTTGAPKAVVFSRPRELFNARFNGDYLELKPGDRMYSCLPAYHAAFRSLCFTPCIRRGAAIIMSRKFSHKTFWPEVRESRATIIQYVGELCRYLVNAPPSSQDRDHHVNMAWGNGMRPDVWEVFRERFGIEMIHELYASSDGLASTRHLNRGPFGRNGIAIRGPLWHLVRGKFEKRIVIDVDTEGPLRNANGYAVEAKAGEAGETVTKLDAQTSAVVFSGYYKNEAAIEKRILRNLFEEGDMWFRSGDVMRLDPDGVLYFVDRLGDTFRWRSENVSTSEVADVMGEFDQIAETNVYGVMVPNSDGRAGCAAIVPVEGLSESDLDFSRMAKHNLKSLPRYAVPIFVRVVKQLSYTGTMKMQKGKLRAQGIELDKIEQAGDDGSQDKIYWLPPGKEIYVPFEKKDWEDVKSGSVRL